jgi:hypothetical protein
MYRLLMKELYAETVEKLRGKLTLRLLPFGCNAIERIEMSVIGRGCAVSFDRSVVECDESMTRLKPL